MGSSTPVSLAELAAWAREARFVFTGVVEQIGSLLQDFLPAGPKTAVIRVERVHHSTRPLSKCAGHQVTVRFRDAEALAVGKRLVFFTNPILYGETIAVDEVGHVDAPDDPGIIERVVQDKVERGLAEHLGKADAVVQGRVVSLTSAPTAAAERRSRRDPNWWIAVIQVIRTLKGEVTDEISVRYPNGRYSPWHRSPKPLRGQEAIWVLHRDGLEVGGVSLALRHPLDVHPAGQAEIECVGRLLQSKTAGEEG